MICQEGSGACQHPNITALISLFEVFGLSKRNGREIRLRTSRIKQLSRETQNFIIISIT